MKLFYYLFYRFFAGIPKGSCWKYKDGDVLVHKLHKETKVLILNHIYKYNYDACCFDTDMYEVVTNFTDIGDENYLMVHEEELEYSVQTQEPV